MAMTHKEEIKAKIIQILLNYEDQLSDGYNYYCGDTKEDVEAKLSEIAEKILKAIRVINK